MSADRVTAVECSLAVKFSGAIARYGAADCNARTVDRDRVTAEGKHDSVAVHRDGGWIAAAVVGNRLELIRRNQRYAVVRIEL